MDQLWNAFDKDSNGGIDQEELQQIIFHVIVIFWEYATPKKPVPKRDQLQCVIDLICSKLKAKIDLDNNGQIKRNKFDQFGKYLMDQWNECQRSVKEMKENRTPHVCKRKNKTLDLDLTHIHIQEVLSSNNTNKH